jgi:hypothetical protein
MSRLKSIERKDPFRNWPIDPIFPKLNAFLKWVGFRSEALDEEKLENKALFS